MTRLMLLCLFVVTAWTGVACDDKPKARRTTEKAPAATPGKPAGEMTRRTGAAAKQLQQAHGIREKRMKNIK